MKSQEPGTLPAQTDINRQTCTCLSIFALAWFSLVVVLGLWVWPLIPELYSSIVTRVRYPDADTREERPLARVLTTGNFHMKWSQINPEEVVELRWKDSANLTNTFHHSSCPGDLEYFGNSWVSENEGAPSFFFASLVGWGTKGDWSQVDATINIQSISSGCPGSANILIHTSYQLFNDEQRANLIEVQRVFEFGDIPYPHDVRPFIPRLHLHDGFSQVLHPDASGTVLITQTTEGCGLGCLNPDWDGSWFAMHNPNTGMGMIVRHVLSEQAAALWIDDDGGTDTNATSVLLLHPHRGFTGTVLEIEYLCFYDSSIWSPSLTLPLGCQL